MIIAKICIILLCMITVTPQEQAVGQSQTSSTPQPQSGQIIISNDSIPLQTHPGDISNVSPQEMQKLLHEESIRAQLHSNSSLNLADLAKLTPEQQRLFAAKLAEQSRLAYERAQKKLKQRQQKQHEQMQRLLANTKLQKSQEIKMTESLKIKSMYFKEGYSNLLSSTKDYLFDMEPDTEQQFLLSLTVGQDIAFVTTIYTNKDGVYVKPTGLQNHEPLILQIYQNNTMIMYESRTFFSDGHVFKGQPNATYYFRFINRKNHRLISFKTSIIVQQSHINSKATSADVSSHASRTKNIQEGLYNRLMNSDTQLTLSASNRRRLTSQIRVYYLYTIGEMVMFVILVFVQVEMIRKLLGSASIV